MATLLLDPGVVYVKDPFNQNSHPHRWWAERGRIHHEDQVTGAYGSQTVRETLERLRGLNDMISNSRGRSGWLMNDEISTLQKFVTEMTELCKKAQQQGMPDDPNHVKQIREKVKSDRQSRMVVLPGFQNTF